MKNSAVETHAGEVLQLIEEIETDHGRAVSYVEHQTICDDVTKSWIRQARYDEAIDYLVDQHEHCGGEEWCNLLADQLVNAADVQRLHRLFGGLIAGRVSRFWIEKPHAEEGLLGNIANAAEYKAAALRIMYKYFSVMHSLDEKAEMSSIRQAINRLNDESKPTKPALREDPIDEPMFWRLIEDAASNSPSSAAFANVLTDELSKFRATEIRHFNELLHRHHDCLSQWDLWAFAHIARDGCSDDGFDYFRWWLIAQGRSTFDAAMNDLDSLITVYKPRWNLQCEELAYVTDKAYLIRADTQLVPDSLPQAEMSGNQWLQSELPDRYPRLWRYFANNRAG